MITIITGIPGAGKTLYTVSEIPKEYKDRFIYYHNIPDLSLPWTELEDPTSLHDLPTGSVTIVDEAHEVFPKRRHDAKEPAYIEKFAVHRHQGHDIVLITQHPMDLDIFIRRRCGLHIHVEKGILNGDSATVLMWPKYQSDTDNPWNRDKADEINWKYPKESFGLYKSTSLVTTKRRMPSKLKKMLLLLVAGVVMVVGGFGYLFNRVSPETNVTTSPDHQIELKGISKGKAMSLTYEEKHTPRVQGLPMTAPIYDEIREPKTYPKLNCISNKEKCICYTQQGTRLTVPDHQCRDIVEYGYFDYAVEEQS